MFNKQAFDADNHKGNCGHWGGPGFGRGKFGNRFGKFGGPFGRGKFWGFFQAPVNIEDTDSAFIIHLYAAGLVKENVKLSVKDDQLTISYQGNDTANPDQPSNPQYTYQEHSGRSFERVFQLNDKVLTDQISATYTDGILKVVLPKNPATNKPAQTITVA